MQGAGRGGWFGERVELNAMTSGQFITWLEGKLDEHEVRKVVPDEEALAKAYLRARFHREVEQAAAVIAARLVKQKGD